MYLKRLIIEFSGFDLNPELKDISGHYFKNIEHAFFSHKPRIQSEHTAIFHVSLKPDGVEIHTFHTSKYLKSTTFDLVFDLHSFLKLDEADKQVSISKVLYLAFEKLPISSCKINNIPTEITESVLLQTCFQQAYHLEKSRFNVSALKFIRTFPFANRLNYSISFRYQKKEHFLQFEIETKFDVVPLRLEMISENQCKIWFGQHWVIYNTSDHQYVIEKNPAVNKLDNIFYF